MLKTRIITAIALLATFIPALFYLSIAWQILTLGICLLALHEWTQFFSASAKFKQNYLGLAAVLGLGVMFVLFAKHRFPPTLLIVVVVLGAVLPCLFWLLLAPWFLAKKWQLANHFVMAALGLLLLGSVWLAAVALQAFNPWIVLVVIATIAISDSAAYFAGKQFGRHKLAPNISPGKTWEGVAGALVGVTLLGLGLVQFGRAPLAVLPLLWVLAALGIVGDLFESLLKRQHGLKDSGHLLPGHGGVLDRIDALIPALPAAFLVLVFLTFFSDFQ